MNYEVLYESKFPKSPGMVPFSIVLAHIPSKDPKQGKYVTWVRNDDTEVMGSGHYFDMFAYNFAQEAALKAAKANYKERVMKELRWL